MTDSIQRANAYKLYHEDEAFREPWEKVRAAFVARWQTTSPAEAETRETIYRYLGLMTKLDAFVAEVIRDGEIDQAKLDNLLKLRNAGDSNHLD